MSLTLLDYATPLDPRTGLPAIVRAQPSGYKKVRIETQQDVEQLTRTVADVQNAAEQATRAMRLFPWSGPIVIAKNVTFTLGADLTLAHLIPVARASASVYASPSDVAASSPEQIRFKLENMRVGDGRAFRISIDERVIVLRPAGAASFTCDVWLWVLP